MSQGAKVLVLVALLGLLGVVSYKTFGPKEGPPAAPTCRYGTMPCPNHCLKREAEGWRSMHVEGHPDTDRWMKFVNADGKATAYNQNHVGHVIEVVDGRYTDVGVCPVCGGTTRVCK